MRSLAYPEMKVVYSLDPEEKRLDELVRICLDQINCARLLRLLANNPSTVMTAADLAATVNCDEEELLAALDVLKRFDLLRIVSVGSLQFFGLSENATARNFALRFRSWCEDQRSRLQALEGLVACA